MGWLEFLLLYFPCPLGREWLKVQIQRKKGIKTKSEGIWLMEQQNWRPKGTGPLGAWEETGSGGLGGRTDRCLWPLRPGLGGGVITGDGLWYSTGRTLRLSGSPMPAGLPNTMASSHAP